jgi:hypothetical protein
MSYLMSITQGVLDQFTWAMQRLVIYVLDKGGKPEDPEKNPWNTGKNQLSYKSFKLKKYPT